MLRTLKASAALGLLCILKPSTMFKCSNAHPPHPSGKTPRKVRICIDPSQTVNKAILRPVYQMPTLNEQLHKLAHAKCFSLVDVRDGFLHVPLDEESSRMTTMHTSYGRYRWKRLPFGISSAQEEFQMRLISALEGLEGIICIANDILVFGEGTDSTTAGPANPATLASPGKPPEPFLGHTRTRKRIIKPPLRFKYYELT